MGFRGQPSKSPPRRLGHLDRKPQRWATIRTGYERSRESPQNVTRKVKNFFAFISKAAKPSVGHCVYGWSVALLRLGQGRKLPFCGFSDPERDRFFTAWTITLFQQIRIL